MKLTFFGAAGEVGRSCIMLETANARVLLDAGVKLGEKEEYPVIGDDELRGIDAVLLSHAHLDHSGYIPHLYSVSFAESYYATKPTVELTNVLISDYMRISKPENVSKQGLKDMAKRAKMVEYRKKFELKDMKVTFIPAGHIL
ncbi:MAG: MBL fold metallo-hydrolase, partial [Candidatus Micrarchaeaceae archaeon]